MKVKKGDTFSLVIRRDGIYNPSLVKVISYGKSPGGRRLIVDELPASYASARDIPVNITTDMSEEQQNEIGEALLEDMEKDKRRLADLEMQREAPVEQKPKTLDELFYEQYDLPDGEEVNHMLHLAYDLGRVDAGKEA